MTLNEQLANNIENKQLFDLNLFLERIGNDSDLAQELFGLFLTESELALQELFEGISQHATADTIVRQAHKVKGMCRDLGADDLGNLASQVEMLAKEGRVTEVDAFPAEMKVQYAALAAYIQVCMAEMPVVS